jgi:hypothetical protein
MVLHHQCLAVAMHRSLSPASILFNRLTWLVHIFAAAPSRLQSGSLLARQAFPVGPSAGAAKESEEACIIQLSHGTEVASASEYKHKQTTYLPMKSKFSQQQI